MERGEMNRLAIMLALAALRFIIRGEGPRPDYFVYMQDIRDIEDKLYQVRWLYFR